MEYNFSHKQGDTFYEMPFAVTGTPTLPSISSVKMQLRKECGGLVAYEVDLTVTDVVNGLFKINEQIIDIAEYNYLYDLQITFIGGVVKTWLSGSFNIKCDITK